MAKSKGSGNLSVMCQCGARFPYPKDQYGTTSNVKRDCLKCGKTVVFTTDNGRVAGIEYQGGVRSDLVDQPQLIQASGAVHYELSETVRCANAGAYRACALMCRRCLEVALRDKGVAAKDLEDLIDEALKKGLLKPDDLAPAHAVRLIGNKGAHQHMAAVPPGAAAGAPVPAPSAPPVQTVFTPEFFKKLDHARLALVATEGLLRVLYGLPEPIQ